MHGWYSSCTNRRRGKANKSKHVLCLTSGMVLCEWSWPSLYPCVAMDVPATNWYQPAVTVKAFFVGIAERDIRCRADQLRLLGGIGR